MKIGVLLSGCGVYDGAEIHESVFTLLAIDEIDAEAVCISIDKPQHHVIDHATDEEMNETRNMLKESARIARGNIKNITDVDPADIDALVIPGGFGSAKNFSDWAFNGPDGTILPEVKLMIVNLINIGKPIAALCVSPVLIAKALEDSGTKAELTLGTDKEPSPYDIPGFSAGLEKTGMEAKMKSVREINIDTENKIITAPCYMMEASVQEVRKNIRAAIEALRDLL